MSPLDNLETHKYVCSLNQQTIAVNCKMIKTEKERITTTKEKAIILKVSCKN